MVQQAEVIRFERRNDVYFLAGGAPEIARETLAYIHHARYLSRCDVGLYVRGLEDRPAVQYALDWQEAFAVHHHWEGQDIPDVLRDLTGLQVELKG